MMDNVIQACEKHGVKRLVVTGSYTNMTGNGKGDKSSFSEKDLAAPEGMYGHMRSKRKQEERCIAYEGSLEIITLLPGMLLGPALSRETRSTVLGFKNLIENKSTSSQCIYGVPLATIPCVDVRDCAQAHIRAMLAAPGTFKSTNKRIAIVQQSHQLVALLKLIQNKFYKKGLKSIPTQDISSNMVNMLQPFYSAIALPLPQFAPGVCTDLQISHL